MPAVRNLLLAIVVVFVAAVALLRWRSDAPQPAAPAGSSQSNLAPTPAVAANTPATATAGNGERRGDDDRTTANTTQGLSGRIVDARGQPIAGAVVLAFAVNDDNPFVAAALRQRGVMRQPFGETNSDADGAFRLGLAHASTTERFALRAFAATHADARRTGLTIAAGQWLALSDVTLPTGLVVTGTVRDQDSDAGIADATVTAQSVLDQGLAIHDGADSVRVRTDSNGDYRIDNLTVGEFGFIATADGHALVERLQQHVFDDQENEIDFELPAGIATAGVVVDSDGRGIANALVRAAAAAMTAEASVRTGADGHFVFAGLAAGEYRCSAGAEGYQLGTVEPVTAGARDLRITLLSQGGAHVRVQAADGQPLERYTVTARSKAAGANRPLPGSRSQDVVPAALAGAPFFVLRGLDPGDYQLEVEAAGHAKTLSAPFTVHGAEFAEVTVILRAGGNLLGRVVDGDGRPVAGAVVEALPAEYAADTAAALFHALLVYEAAEARTRSGDDGAFTLRHLAAGNYQLRIDHPAFALRRQRDLRVSEGAVTDAGMLVLAAGTLLSGTASVDHKAAANVVVQVTALDDGGLPRGTVMEAPADAQGRWAIARRLPAGRYAVVAGRRDPANKFQENADRAQSRVELQLAPGEARHTLEVLIQSALPPPQATRRGG